MNREQRHKITTAIRHIYADHPLFGGIAAKWHIDEEPNHPTLATNGPRLIYNAAFLEPMSQAAANWMLDHEAAHVWLGHPWRMRAGHYDPALFNIAADLAVNSLLPRPPAELLAAGHPYPGEGRWSHLPAGQSVEWYYPHVKDALQPDQPDEEADDGQADPTDAQQTADADQGAQADAQDRPADDDGSPDADQGDGQADADGDDQGDAQEGPGDTPGPGDGPTDQEDGETPGSASDTNGDAQASADAEGDQAADPGSSSGGGDGDGAPQYCDPSTIAPGEVLPCPDDPRQAEVEWKIDTAESIEHARECGNLPGYAQSMGAELYAGPPIDPREMLRRFLRQYVREGYSFRRPHRRRKMPGVILPGRTSLSAGRLVLAVDSSGSMSNADCAQALRLLEGVLMAYQSAAVTVLQCDTRVIEEATRTYTRWDFPLDPQAVRWYGREGTELAPALEMVRRMQPRPDAVVVISDMQWRVKKAPDPGIPVVWLDVSGYSERHPGSYRPTFGQVIVLRDWIEAKKRAGRAA